MTTRRFEKRRKNDIVRRCILCRITDDLIEFLIQKDSKNGKFYKRCLCKACYEYKRSKTRREYYYKHRRKQINAARKWNVDNKDRYNRRRRKSFREKFYQVSR